MDVMWENDHEEPFRTGETRMALLAIGDGFVQEVEVEFIRTMDGPYELYRTDPYMKCLSEDVRVEIGKLVELHTMGLTEYVSMQEPHSIPTV